MKKRICPDDCGKPLEKGQHYCTECGEAREYFSQLVAMDKYRKTDKYKQSETRSNLKRVENGYFKAYNQTESRKEYMLNYDRSEKRKVYKKQWALKKKREGLCLIQK